MHDCVEVSTTESDTSLLGGKKNTFVEQTRRLVQRVKPPIATKLLVRLWETCIRTGSHAKFARVGEEGAVPSQ